MTKKSFDSKEARKILQSNREQGISDQATYEQMQEIYYDPNSIADFIARNLSKKDIKDKNIWIYGVSILLGASFLLSLYNLLTTINITGLIGVSGIIPLGMIIYCLYCIHTNNIYEGLLIIRLLFVLGLGGIYDSQNDSIDYGILISSLAILTIIYIAMRKIFPHLNKLGKLRKNENGNYIFPH